jgi:metal-responsive CopG/Arc/MetJ family transcriptional regulator
MGRPKKQEKDCKIKFGISLDRELFDRMVKDKTKKSSLINKLLREYYGKKDLW